MRKLKRDRVLKFGELRTTITEFNKFVDSFKKLENLEEFITFLLDTYRIRNIESNEEIIKMLKRIIKTFEEVKKEMKK